MTAAGALLRALSAKARARLSSEIDSTPWHSVNLGGERHLVTIDGLDEHIADRLLDGLDAHEFVLARTLVADIVAVRHPAETGVRLALEILTIDAA